jgi:L-threonine-O-3-phosphate decarboxylase
VTPPHPIIEPLLTVLAPAVHGGIDADALRRLGIEPAQIIDFSANQSPLGASPQVPAAIAGAVLDAYPDRDARPLTEAVAAYHGLPAAQVVVGNGSTELIRLIAQLALRPHDCALTLTPTFGEYAVAVQLAGACVLPIPVTLGVPVNPVDLHAALTTHAPRLCFLCSPNNPTGHALPPQAIATLVTAFPATLFVLDEAYCDLLPAPQWTSALLEHGNLFILRSMTKAWGLAGVRLGYVAGSASLCESLRRAKPPWNVNACAQAAGLAALDDLPHYEATRALLRAEKRTLVASLSAQGWSVLPSAAAFFLIQVDAAATLQRALLAHRCLVRDCTSFGLPAHIRISPRHPEHNRQLVTAMATLRSTRQP